MHGEPPIAGSLRKGVNPLAKVSGLLSGADVAVVNLETTIAGAAPAGTAQDKTYVFRSTPALLGAVRSAGVDVVSVANNHSYDYGRAGFLATLDQIGASGLQVAGGGHDDAEAYRPAIVDVRGTKVAIVGIARIGPDDVGRATATTPGTTDGRNVRASAAAIAAAKAQAPIVIAFLHWGTELADCATANDRALATALLKAGASAVVGAHPHVLQGISEANGKLVAWSLGNFVFYATRPIARQTGVLTVTFDPTGAVTASRFDPARIDGSGSPVPQQGKAGADIRARLDRVTPGHGTCPAYAMP